jgi:hypothetical protein
MEDKRVKKTAKQPLKLGACHESPLEGGTDTRERRQLIRSRCI